MARKSNETASTVSPHAEEFLTHLPAMQRSGRAGAIQVLGLNREHDIYEAVSFMEMQWWCVCSQGNADSVDDKPSWAFFVTKNRAKWILKEGSKCVQLDDESAEAMLSPISTPDEMAESREVAMIMSDFFDSFVASAQLYLSDEDAEIFHRKIFENEDYRKIAVAIEMLPNTARKRLSRAMEGLGDLFEKEVEQVPAMAEIVESVLYAHAPVKDVLRNLLEVYADGTLRDILDDAEAYDRGDVYESD